MGAEAAVAEILNFSDKRVVVEVLRAGKGYDNIDGDAMNTTEILKEIRATSEYEAFIGDDEMPDTAAQIGHILGTLQEPLKSLNLPPLVDRIEGWRPMFCLNNHVLDRLDAHFKMPAAQGMLLLAPPALSREPSLATPSGSVANAIPLDDVESQDLYQVLQDDEAHEFRSLMMAGEDKSGAGPSGANGAGPSGANGADPSDVVGQVVSSDGRVFRGLSVFG